MDTAIKILTLNTAGLNNQIKRKRIGKLLRDEKADLVCHQKTHLRSMAVKYIRQVFSRFFFHAAFSAKAKGILLDISKRLVIDIEQCILDSRGRYIIWWGKVFHLKLIIVGIYAPNAAQETFCEELGLLMPEKKQSILVIGYFNSVLDFKLDHSTRTQTSTVWKGF